MADLMTKRNSSYSQFPATSDSDVLDSQFHADVLSGLTESPKALPCKYLYDEAGSKLFDRICELEEYYPTRTEAQIIFDSADEIGKCIRSNVVLIEYGSGSSTKTRVLLDHLDHPLAYVPVDISEEHLLSTGQKLRDEYPELDIRPIVADFTSSFALPEDLEESPVCVYFPGSTIGNFEPEAAVGLLRSIAWQCGSNGGLLIGFDLQKSKDILELAYDDPHGVTAAFSLNILHRMNRELDATFEADRFQHVSFYNERLGRIEIYLESLDEQQVTIGDTSIEFQAGERIHTEYSHKYTIDSFAEMAKEAGFRSNAYWTDPNNLFALMHLIVE